MNPQQIKFLLAALTVSLISALSSVGWAGLGPPNYMEMPISEEEPSGEAEFPAPVVLEAKSISRADRSDKHSKSGLGFFTLGIDGYKLEYSGATGPELGENLEDAEYGLLFEIEGEYPATFPIPQEVVVLGSPTDQIYFHWGDRDTRRDSIDAMLTATWVDRYGRQGPTSDPVHITDGGSTIGCSSTGAGTTPKAILLLMLLFGFMRRGDDK